MAKCWPPRKMSKALLMPVLVMQDAPVAAACDEYGIAMALSGVRIFHH